jgi:hypothetical protein
MTNSGFSCITINSLPEISFIAGDTQVFEFTVYDENSSPIDLSSNTLDWNMAYYGQPDVVVLNKTPILSATTNVFNVTLDESDTIALSGKFIHQPYIKDYAGNVYRYGQGIITIVPAIV